MPLPWPLRRRILEKLFGYHIAATAHIGLSIVIPGELVMQRGSYIGHGTLARGMDRITLAQEARIGHFNWIYGIPRAHISLSHEPDRRAELVLDDSAVITRRHLIDCSNAIHLGEAAAVVGYRTQLITHGLSMTQAAGLHTKPIELGTCSLVGTGSIVLGGARLPDYSALGAGSTLRSAFSETHSLYSGVPAQLVQRIPSDAAHVVRNGART